MIVHYLRVVHKAELAYNPNRNTALDRMIREEKEKNPKEKKCT